MSCSDQRFAEGVDLRTKRARAIVVSTVVAYVAVHVALICTPTLRDPEYGYRLTNLRNQQQAHPGQPTVLLLGSSRMAMNVHADLLPTNQGSDGPIVFNFGQCRAGPLEELIALNRLFADGVRPAWVFVETHYEMYRNDFTYDTPSALRRYGWADVEILKRYVDEPNALDRYRLSSHLAPWHHWRVNILAGHLPDALAADERRVVNDWQTLTPWGAVRMPLLGVPPAGREGNVARVESYSRHFLTIVENGEITNRASRAFREMKELCDQHGCRMALLSMPDIYEHYYPPTARERISAEVNELSTLLDVPVLDFRLWGEPEDFFDAAHLCHSGADRFTADFQPYLLRVLADPLPQQTVAWPRPTTFRPACRWEEGFSVEESGSVPGWRRFRWCAAEGVMTVDNPMPTTRRVTLSFSPQSFEAGPCNFTIEGPGLSETVRIHNGPTPLLRILELQPGTHTFRFRCDGQPGVFPARTIVFALHEFKLEGIAPPS